jgi:LDH2 family malate/lactate/ureidoglycolate dehydrogenase
MPDNITRLISYEKLVEFCTRAYEAHGVPPEEARIGAEYLVRSDLRGVATHGVMRLSAYIRRLEQGWMRPAMKMEIIRSRGATSFVKAFGSMGQLVAHHAMGMALDLAAEHGIGWINVIDSSHFGTAGLFAMRALEKDFVGFLCSNSAPQMAPYGGRSKIMGNNPLAYAFPAGPKPPVVLDFSCSTVSVGRVILSAKKGLSIPEGWAVDGKGRPTTDPLDVSERGGSLLPMAAHKGYGLAVAHEILSAVLGGGRWTMNINDIYKPASDGIQGTCHSFMALDPECFAGKEEFIAGITCYIDAIKGSPKAEGSAEIFYPGERSARIEAERLASGIPISEAVADDLHSLASRLEVPLRFE